MRVRSFHLVAGAALMVGCGAGANGGARSAQSSSRAALDVGNGDVLNGVIENGIQENGSQENGIQENGSQENGSLENGSQENGERENGDRENGDRENGDGLNKLVRYADLAPVFFNNGVSWDSTLAADTLTGHRGNKAISGADYVGGYFTGALANGKPIVLRITAHRMAAAPNADLDEYYVEWRRGGGLWHPMCPDGSGGLYATATYGYWDFSAGTPTGGAKTNSSSRFTFACPNGAIGKCINWGYRPWASVAGVSLAPYHQACTRLARADYCGDGTPHTVNGVTINIYDNLGIETDTENWIFEAQWSPAGATCMAPMADPSRVACYGQKLTSSCTPDSPSAMLSSETPTGARVK